MFSVWISSDDVVPVAKKGFRLIHAASDYFYLVGLQEFVCLWKFVL
jgi:hypothetical protein